MDFSSSQILDLVVLGVLLLSAVIGAIRGFFKSVVNIAVLVISVFGSKLLASWWAEPVTNFLYPKLSGSLSGFVSSKIGFNVTLLDAEKMEVAIKSVLQPIARYVLWVAIGLVLYIVLNLLGKLLNKLIDESKFAKNANKGLGAVLGIVSTLVICYLVVFGLNKFGLKNAAIDKFPDSISIKALDFLVPESVETLAINIPGIGEVKLDPDQINLDKFFKDVKLDELEKMSKEQIEELLNKAKK